MGTRRDLSAFVLLAHLVSLSTGNIEGGVEKILPNNASIVLIENKPSKVVDEALGNVTSLTRGYNNFSMAPETTTSSTATMRTTTMNITTLVQEEKILEDKLKEALESAASAGQVILVSTSHAENTNTTNEILGPVVLIESSLMSSKSSIDDTADHDDKIKQSARIFDQEFAQSQTRTRTDPRSYEDDNDIENIEDLLAIAEYEPQKLDAKKIEVATILTSRDETDSQILSSNHALPEEKHYDVPRRRNLPGNSPKVGEYPSEPKTPNTTTLREPLTRLTLAALPSKSSQIQEERTAPRLELSAYNDKAERGISSSTSEFSQKPTDGKWSREPRHLKPSASLTTSQPTTLAPGLPASIQEQFIYSNFNNNDVQSFTVIPEFSKQYHRSSSLNRPPVFLPPKVQTYPPNQIFLHPERSFRQSTVAPPRIPHAASRRIDDYLSPDYAKPVNHDINPLLNNQQLGFLTRYNLPSLLTPRLTRPRSYPPVALPYGQPIAIAKDTKEEEANNESGDSSEKKNPIISRNNVPAYDYYEDSDETSQGSQQRVSRKPALVGNSGQIIPTAESPPTYDTHGDSADLRASEIYRKNGNSLPTSTTPVYRRYENYEKAQSPKLISRQQSFNPRAEQHQGLTSRTYVDVPTNPYVGVSTKPIYQTYDYLGRGIPPGTPINFSNIPIYSYQTGQPDQTLVSPNNAYTPNKNYPNAIPDQSSRNLVKPSVSYDSYEDTEEKTKSPRVINEKIRDPSYVDDRYGYSKSVQTTQSSPVSVENGDYVYSEESGDNYASLPANTARVDPQRALNTYVRISSPAHVKISDTDSNEDDEANDEETSNSPGSSKLWARKFSHLGAQNNRETSLVTEAPKYDSYEYSEPDYVNARPVPASSTSNEPTSVNYGSRVAPLLVRGHDENSQPLSRPQTFQTRPTSLPYEWSEKQRTAPTRVNEEPAESVDRADVAEDATDYEDEEPASSGHEENHENYETREKSKKDEGGDKKSEKGGGEKHEEGHHASENEKGEKGYKEWHEYDKGEKGHRDKENHENEYDEAEGDKKKHEDVSGYHKEHHHGEKGNKESEFGEKGEHQKGHSTKGQHVVHKKDEYEKKTEFYDESHEEDGNEKEGEYHYEHENKKGGHEKIGHHDSGHHEDKYGKKGEHEKGQHWDETKGHEKKDGGEQDHHHEEKYGKKGAHEEGEKWSHKKGDNGKR